MLNETTTSKTTVIEFGRGASRLDTDASLAPMSPLGVVPVRWRVRQRPVLYIDFHYLPPKSIDSLSCFLPSSHLLGSFIYSAGEVVPDGVVGSKANPLRDRTVLLLGLGQLLLGAEGLVGLYCSVRIATTWFPVLSIKSYRHLDYPCRWS